MFRAVNPSQDLSVKKSYFEVGIWILSLMSNADGFSQRMKCRNFYVDAALLCTVWTQTFCLKWKTVVMFL